MKKTKRIVALLLSLTLCLGVMGTASAASIKDFTDFDAGAWYAEAVENAVDNGLLYGRGDGHLEPTGQLTRAEMAAVINRAFGTYVLGDMSGFTDVPENAWYRRDIQMAYHMGTYMGRGSGIMAPETPITREEVMAVLCRALQLDTARYANTKLTKFRDSAEIKPWALPEVRAMVGAGYVQGDGYRLNPGSNITRAEFAQIFHNIIKEYITEDGVYTGIRRGSVLISTGGVTLRNMTIYGDLIIGNGVANKSVTLSNVTVTGRVVVWGGGTKAVWMNDGTYTSELVVCRVDGPVKVIFDRDSTLAVYNNIRVRVTDRAKRFPDTEVIFYDISDILEEQDRLNEQVNKDALRVAMPADLFALVDSTEVKATLTNNSALDTYTIDLRRNYTGDAVIESIVLGPHTSQVAFELLEALPYGDHPCTATIQAKRDGKVIGTLELAVTIHVAYLWEV